MPVHLESHEPDVDLTPGTTKSDIVAFLYNNPEYGYKPAEIREHLDIPHGTATATLKRLHEDRYVGKTDDSYYHALEHREDIRRYVAGLDQLDRMFNQPAEEESPSNPDPDDEDPDGIDEAALESELEDLEDELGE